MFESPWHWLVVVAVAFVLFFGWKQLPDMARSLGRSLRIFKTEMKGMTQDDKDRAEASEQKPRELPPAQVVRNDGAERSTLSDRTVSDRTVSDPYPGDSEAAQERSRPRPAPRPAADPAADRSDSAR
jgi:sec-independent protein translocase protein TatA